MKLPLAISLTCLLVAAGPSDPVEVDFGVLAGFDYVEGMQLPDEVLAYDERTVKVSGFMRREEDLSSGDEVEYFALINDACGCEGVPKMNEVVFCAMPEGEVTSILPGVVSVTGTLYVGELVEEDIVVALYTLDVDSIDASEPQ